MAKAIRRCSDHKTRQELPRLCHVCQRLAVEQDIVEQSIKALFMAKFQVAIENGDDERLGPFTYQPEIGMQASADIVLAEMFVTDDEYLIVREDGQDFGWVRFVYGNSGYDVISDYTTNFEDVLSAVNAYAESQS